MHQTEINLKKKSLATKEHNTRSKTKTCTLCGSEFYPASHHARFCKYCKTHNNEYLYSDWLGGFGSSPRLI